MDRQTQGIVQLAQAAQEDHGPASGIHLEVKQEFKVTQDDVAHIVRLIRDDDGGLFLLQAQAADLLLYGAESYEVNALYYLQKPYEHNHFINAMTRCVDLIRQAQQNFTFMVRQKQITIPYTDIVFFETGRHTVILHTLSDSITFSESYSNIIEALCDTNSFLPMGRSYLINLNQVACSHNGDLLMADGSVVQIPVKKRGEILTFVEEWKKK